MIPVKNDFRRGLEGVIAGESTICLVDGDTGNLFYRGYSIFDLCEKFTYEEVAYLLLHKTLPDSASLKEFNEKLLKYRRYNSKIVQIVRNLPYETHPMKMLQSTVAALGGIWDNKDGVSAQETFIAYISQLPLIVASHWRFMNNLELIEPDKTMSYAGNFLHILQGETPTPQQTRILNKALITHMEHGFNASTFSGRVVASSMATVSSSLSAAIGSLSGPLHGGANERALEMIDEIGKIERTEEQINKRLARGEKIMGMGHRIYRQKDPRAIIVQNQLKEMAEDPETARRIAILQRIEDHVTKVMLQKGKEIYPNVDFYSGTLFAGLGINQLLFTPICAMARIVGWCAHIGEQWENNRLIRPKCLYVGDRDREVEEVVTKPIRSKRGNNKIMILDDDVDLIEAIQVPLEANGYMVSFSTRYKGATDLVAKIEPDLVLLDVMFPGNPTAGFDICMELKDRSDTQNIPVIILSAINQKIDTAFSSSISSVKYDSVPADRFLEKPVNPETLLTVIEQILRKHGQ